MSAKPLSNAALLRKVARLEAQLESAQEFVKRMSGFDIQTVMQNGDMRLRIKQAAELLAGGDA